MPTYLIKQTFTSKQAEQTVERLVEAPNKARAIAHVAADTITAEPAEIADAMRLASEGVKLEKVE